MLKKSEIEKMMKKHGVETFGAIRYDALSHLIECRAKARLPQNAQSVIVCLFPYALSDTPPHNVCRYAFFEDYHEVIGRGLKAIASELSEMLGGSFEAFTDNSPIPEIEAAVKAGLGFRGRNGLLINEKYGSYALIGEIVTDAFIEEDKEKETGCFDCGACEQACPTGAICKNEFKVESCLSHITQRKGELSSEEENAIKAGGLAWGCDICQECCPHNRVAEKNPYKPFMGSIEPVLTYENLDELIKTRPYGYKGKKLILRNLNIIKGE